MAMVRITVFVILFFLYISSTQCKRLYGNNGTESVRPHDFGISRSNHSYPAVGHPVQSHHLGNATLYTPSGGNGTGLVRPIGFDISHTNRSHHSHQLVRRPNQSHPVYVPLNTPSGNYGQNLSTKNHQHRHHQHHHNSGGHHGTTVYNASRYDHHSNHTIS